jgi:glutamate/tyrosine decarboxylase-like PLP-dependent enzyme
LKNRDLFDKVSSILDDFLSSENTSSTIPYLSPEELDSKLDLSLNNEGRDMDSVLSSIKDILDYTPRTGSPVFFNQLFAGKDMPSIAGDMITAGLNNSMYTYKAAGAQILVEKSVIERMLALVGMNSGEGTLVPGGSLSNLTATLAAVNHKNPEHRDKGNNGKKYIAYTSEECHYSLRKNMGILGLGRDNMRYCKANSAGQLDPDDLSLKIEEDLKLGNIPFLVVATTCTTVRGAFDDLEKLGKVAKNYGIWFHVDAAYGGSLILHPDYKEKFNGLELADSFTWDPHKMLGSTLLCSAILFREKGILKSIYNETADYLFQTEQDYYNPGNHTLQCGRRNDALKLWTAWRFHGEKGYEAMLEKHTSLADYAAKVIGESNEMDLVFPPDSVNICFNYIGVKPEIICSELDKRGMAKVGYGTSGGHTFIRLVTVNSALGNEHIDMLMGNILKVGRELTTNQENHVS